MCAERLKVALCWHMHQPEYRDRASGAYRLPWTYLHAIKDYADMAAHLEAVPEARAVVNFAPILLEQLADYAAQIEASLAERRPIRDPLLEALAGERLPAEPEARVALVKSAMRANEKRLIDRFPAYRRLCGIARELLADPPQAAYLSDQLLADLLVWYHLAWLGETVRREAPLVRELMDRSHGFGAGDRRRLLALVGALVAGVVPRYRALAERGQVELSTSPYGHPIVPLLIDAAVAAEAVPGVALPAPSAYPDGEARARWHLREGASVFERHFGFAPRGCWPSEGGVSTAALALLGELGFTWAASGESVLGNSLRALGEPLASARRHQPYRLAGREGPLCFFRSDELSDDIGFNFASWHSDDAVGHLLHRLEQMRAECDAPAERVVAIILDGENAWEFYPENGYYFLSTLYARLASHPLLEMVTFSQAAEQGLRVGELPRLVAGSWVYGSFSTWIGAPAKNLAWQILVQAKRAFDRCAGALAEGARAAALAQLAVCEGSDWFWWPGDYNPAASVRDFDELFRLHVGRLYELLGEEPPEELSRPIASGGAEAELGGVMRRGAP